MPREQEQVINVIFDNKYFSTTVILGEPGTGKSALLSRVGAKLINERQMVLGIRADQLDNSINDFASLGRFLGLPDQVDRCVLAAAKFGRVFVIIDQLDTLSELIDVKTERLSVLLSLINQLSGKPNIHILASSRPFEFKHDARFSTIDAKQVTLPSLEWNSVADRLKANKITIDSPDQAFKRFLCRPSSLNFYLSYVTKHPTRAFSSYIDLYENIWKESLGPEPYSSGRRNLLLELATLMTDGAKQALPLLNYDSSIVDIEWLIDAGLLIKSNNDRSISFTHQTLQAFVWTRSFIGRNSSLIEFIIDHQNNLNIRPKLNTVLLYLRDADVEKYNEQIATVFIGQRVSIRKHVKHLVIDCITGHTEPNNVEASIISQLIFEDEFLVRIGNGILGKALWFDKALSSTFGQLMSGKTTQQFSSAFLLSGIYHERKEDVLKLVRQYWINVDAIENVFQFLRYIENWDEELFDIACEVLKHGLKYPNAASFLFQVIKDKSPQFAIRLAGKFFESDMERLVADYKARLPVTSENTNDSDFVDRIVNNPRHSFERLLEFGNDWYNLQEVAVKNSELFIDAFWPSFLIGCEYTKVNYGDSNSYEDCGGIWFHISEDGYDYADRYLSSSLEKSIAAFAKENPHKFLQFYKSNIGSILLPVQRLLAEGFVEIGPKYSTEGLNFLLEDERRFMLGNFEDRHSGTKRLITAIAPNLNESELVKLKQSIRAYKARTQSTDRSSEYKRWDLNHNRKIVYQLLSAIPEHLRDKNTVRQLKEEKRALGIKVESNNGYSGMVRATSAMTKEQMARAKDDDIYQCLQQFPDKRGDDWPVNQSYKSATELAREFEQFATEYPLRAVGIITRLNRDNLQAITMGFTGLGKSNLPFDDLLVAIHQKEQQAPVPYFYEDAASVIKSRLDKENVLSEGWIKRIEQWLVISNDHQEYKKENRKEKEEESESIIWNNRTIYFVPNGNYAILDCLTFAMFARPIPMINEWAELILKHIGSGDKSALWSGFLAIHMPRFLARCNREDAAAIIDSIINHYPELMDDAFLGRTLVSAIHWADDKSFFEWIDKLQAHGTTRSRQLYGELLVAKLAIHEDNKLAISNLEELVSRDCDPAILCGIAHALENVWEIRKSMATQYIVRIFALKKQEISQILLGILSTRDKLDPGKEMMEILDALILNRTLESKKGRVPFLAKALLSLTTKEPGRIFELSNHLISSWGSQLGDISTAAVSDTPDLITIGITLHNLGPNYQGIGLDIFERLLDLNAYKIRDVLTEIDGIPQVYVSH